MSSLMESIGFKCQRCGKCCKWGGPILSANKEDFERWKREGREDIIGYIDFITVSVCPICKKGTLTKQGKCITCGASSIEQIVGADLWFDPVTGEELQRCPFLRKIKNRESYECMINDTKPHNCKEFPVYVATECDKCRLSFVKYFKDGKFKDIPLKEFFKWSPDDFYLKALEDVDKCPQCGKPITKFTFNQWATENCPATKVLLAKK